MCHLDKRYLITNSNFQGICNMNRKNLLIKHIIDGDSRAAVGIQPVYVTSDERSAAEDIGNATKEEILRRADEKHQLLSDVEVKADLLKKLGAVCKHISRIKKDTFYEDIVEEVNNADILETVCQSAEIDEHGDLL